MATSTAVQAHDPIEMDRREMAMIRRMKAEQTPDRLTIQMYSWPNSKQPFEWVATWRSVNADGSFTTRTWRNAYDLTELLRLLEKAGVKLS